MWRLVSVLMLWIICIGEGFSASVWQVSRGEQHLYIGGTFHLLSASDYPLPKQYDIAYHQSQKVIFETDIDGFNSPEFSQKLQRYSYTRRVKRLNPPCNLPRFSA